ncbi:Putative signal transducing protein [Mesonia phycicola]|uniref:Putative signal transducing protein n=1 Tax=Mesonia phycicola TaxID=579105 RepID=A0A1M6CP94_9FLAO|nr:DUF2007 domain-containing protein [Mesonia phycicola]SHI62827.1 Putative signal transducing protein [Mesonia phycicola]
MKEKYIKIATYQFSSEAQIFKGRLEAEGIHVLITDQYTIDTDPLISNAIGGVKLLVLKEDKARAESVLAELSAYSLDDNGGEVYCPKCKGSKIDYFTNVNDIKAFLAFIVNFLLLGLYPIYTKYEYRCEDCKEKFNVI